MNKAWRSQPSLWSPDGLSWGKSEFLCVLGCQKLWESWKTSGVYSLKSCCTNRLPSMFLHPLVTSERRLEWSQPQSKSSSTFVHEGRKDKCEPNARNGESSETLLDPSWGCDCHLLACFLTSEWSLEKLAGSFLWSPLFCTGISRQQHSWGDSAFQLLVQLNLHLSFQRLVLKITRLVMTIKIVFPK